jgi:hypothetical protein
LQFSQPGQFVSDGQLSQATRPHGDGQLQTKIKGTSNKVGTLKQ